jgi:hypothetical protein
MKETTIYDNLDDKQHVLGIFLDTNKKAFDFVDHKINYIIVVLEHLHIG